MGSLGKCLASAHGNGPLPVAIGRVCLQNFDDAYAQVPGMSYTSKVAWGGHYDAFETTLEILRAHIDHPGVPPQDLQKGECGLFPDSMLLVPGKILNMLMRSLSDSWLVGPMRSDKSPHLESLAHLLCALNQPLMDPALAGTVFTRVCSEAHIQCAKQSGVLCPLRKSTISSAGVHFQAQVSCLRLDVLYLGPELYNLCGYVCSVLLPVVPGCEPLDDDMF
eukprot:1157272-Pelagomonas_calceolata.AAC.7